MHLTFLPTFPWRFMEIDQALRPPHVPTPSATMDSKISESFGIMSDIGPLLVLLSYHDVM